MARVPGRTAAELNAGTTRFSVARAETLIVRDSFFAFLLGASLIAFALGGANWTSARGRRLQLVAIGAAAGRHDSPTGWRTSGCGSCSTT